MRIPLYYEIPIGLWMILSLYFMYKLLDALIALVKVQDTYNASILIYRKLLQQLIEAVNQIEIRIGD